MRHQLMPALLAALLAAGAHAAPAADELLRQADFWAGRGRDDLARTALDKLLRQAPGHAAARARLAELQPHSGRAADGLDGARALLRAGRPAQAQAVLRKLPAPRDAAQAAEYWRLLGRTPGGAGPARRALQALLQAQPDQVEAQLALAELELGRRQPARGTLEAIVRIAAMPRYQAAARALWRRAVLGLAPAPANLALLDDYLRAEGRDDGTARARRAAMAHALARQAALQADPFYRARRQGEALLAAGQLAAAAQQFTHALQGRPDDGAALGGLGLVYLRQERQPEAESQFLRAARADRAQAAKWQALQRTARFWGLLRLAREAAENGDAAQAERLLAQADAAAPGAAALAAARARLAERAQAPDTARLYGAALAAAPDDATLRADAAAFHARAGDEAQAAALLAGLETPARARVQLALQRRQAARLRQQGDTAHDAGQGPAALALYEEGAALDPDDPWLAHALARQYAAQGQPQRGAALLAGLAARQPQAAATRYAQALFLGGQELHAEALAALDAIPAAQRSAAMRAEHGRLQVALLVQRARAQAGAGDVAGARAALLAGAAAHAAAPESQLDIADALRPLDPAAARALLQAMPAAPEALALRRARLLASAGAPEAALAALAAVPPAAATAGAWHAAADAIALDDAAALRGAGRFDAALRTLAPRLARQPGDNRLLAERARIESAMGQPQAALASYRQAAPAAPEDTAAMAGLLLTAGQAAEARTRLQQALAVHPRALALLDQAGALAQREGRIDAAIDYYRRGNAEAGPPPEPYRERRLAELLERRSAWLSLADEHQQRSGSAGRAQLRMDEWVAEYRPAQRGPDRFALRADLVALQAGTLDPAAPEARDAGSVALCAPTCAAGAAVQRARGIALHAAWERGAWRADLGTTPLGFPLHTWVGALGVQQAAGPVSLAAELSRRALTSSLLSYAGMTDPASGRRWGGVTANGLRLSASQDDGGALGAWSTLQWQQLGGTAVQDNRRLQTQAGLVWRLVHSDDALLALGATALDWRSARNAGEYSFGHGGYYSPQRHRALSLPLTVGQRTERFSWTVRAALSRVRASTAAADYFPTDAALQARAEAQAGSRAGLPHHAAASSRGIGRSLAAQWEARVRPDLFVGGRLSLERSVDYAPNRFLLYLRYGPGHTAERSPALPPEAVLPSSQY